MVGRQTHGMPATAGQCWDALGCWMLGLSTACAKYSLFDNEHGVLILCGEAGVW